MAWFVQALQRKSADGVPLGIWHLCANSDEGGAFTPGCGHNHASSEEAERCLQARKYLGQVTGFPLEMDKITINGVAVEWPHDDRLAYEDICKLAGQPDYASVTYHAKLGGDASRSGILAKGDAVKTVGGMTISCIVTGAA